MKDCDTKEKCIDLDIDWLKEKLRGLTKTQRLLMLEGYTTHVQQYGVGIAEYKAFVKAFDELED